MKLKNKELVKDSGLSRSDLVLYAIYVVTIKKKEETCTFERVVAECFKLFPETFAFLRYPHWPDSTKIERPLRTLREKGIISGQVRGHFKLTPIGIKQATILASKINRNLIEKPPPDLRSGDERLVNYMLNSTLFQNYIKNKENFKIDEKEARQFLLGTVETPVKTLRRNLWYFLNLAREFQHNELFDFLKLIEQQIFVKKRKGKHHGKRSKD
jgi:hypothetical protein